MKYPLLRLRLHVVLLSQISMISLKFIFNRCYHRFESDCGLYYLILRLMEELNLKRAGAELFNNQSRVEATLSIVCDGKVTSAIMAGDYDQLVEMLSEAMIIQPSIKKLLSASFLAAMSKQRVKD